MYSRTNLSPSPSSLSRTPETDALDGTGAGAVPRSEPSSPLLSGLKGTKEPEHLAALALAHPLRTIAHPRRPASPEMPHPELVPVESFMEAGKLANDIWKKHLSHISAQYDERLASLEEKSKNNLASLSMKLTTLIENNNVARENRIKKAKAKYENWAQKLASRDEIIEDLRRDNEEQGETLKAAYDAMNELTRISSLRDQELGNKSKAISSLVQESKRLTEAVKASRGEIIQAAEDRDRVHLETIEQQNLAHKKAMREKDAEIDALRAEVEQLKKAVEKPNRQATLGLALSTQVLASTDEGALEINALRKENRLLRKELGEYARYDNQLVAELVSGVAAQAQSAAAALEDDTERAGKPAAPENAPTNRFGKQVELLKRTIELLRTQRQEALSQRLAAEAETAQLRIDKQGLDELVELYKRKIEKLAAHLKIDLSA